MTQEICNCPEVKVCYLIGAVWQLSREQAIDCACGKQAHCSVKHSCTIQLGCVCHNSSCRISNGLLSLICLVRHPVIE